MSTAAYITPEERRRFRALQAATFHLRYAAGPRPEWAAKRDAAWSVLETEAARLRALAQSRRPPVRPGRFTLLSKEL